MLAVSLISFFLFTGLVAVGTWLIVRRHETSSRDGFFLAGRNLSFPVIAGSLLLTNLSTEQMVGLNGSAFKEGMSVMAWEVMAVVALVLMALWFLPKFLRAGVTTVPEYLRLRFDETCGALCNIIVLLSYMVILLPIILYTGARGMLDILDLAPLIGVENEMIQLYILVIIVAVIGGAYALCGGLSSCAVSDTLNGIGLLIGGIMISFFAFDMLGDGAFTDGVAAFFSEGGDRLNSLGSHDSEAPFFGLFTGIFLINTFYWCTNQQIIQRTLGAKSLAEGQKGVLLTGALKLLGPVYLVFPGMIAAMLFMNGALNIPVDPETGLAVSDKAYGTLVNAVLPAPLKGFFAAVLLGAILSSFNSVLNSTCTLFSLDIYKRWINKQADDRRVVRMGQVFGFIVAAASVVIAPMLMKAGSIFGYLQSMNGLTFIPLLAVVIAAMNTKRVPAIAANVSLIGGMLLNALGYFVSPVKEWAATIGQFHYVAIVFCLMVIVMVIWGWIAPQKTPFADKDAGVTDLTPWKYLVHVSLILLAVIALIYISFADISVFRKGKPSYPAYTAVQDSGTDFATQALQSYIDSGELPGVISVFYQDGFQETACLGWANVEKQIPINMDQIFMQCSQTKSVCGVSIAILVEEGKLDLDDPVSKYLPEFAQMQVLQPDGTTKPAETPVTVRMVMNHTAGFPFEIPTKSEKGWPALSLRETAKEAAQQPLHFEPGTDIIYSNTGIDIGAAVAEVVTGMPWEEFLQQRLFTPLGMKDATFNPTNEQLSRSICLYDIAAGQKAVYRECTPQMPLPHNGPTVHPSAGAGLWLSAADQLKYLKMLVNGGIGDNGVRILKEETVRNLLVTTTRPEHMYGYSLGFGTDGVNFGHTGAWGTFFSINLEDRSFYMCVVQLCGDQAPMQHIYRTASQRFFDHVTALNTAAE